MDSLPEYVLLKANDMLDSSYDKPFLEYLPLLTFYSKGLSPPAKNEKSLVMETLKRRRKLGKNQPLRSHFLYIDIIF